ncbi:MAG TPA: DEAD/DEAH box helicase [Polyangiaceae bacterium]|nr:DEAD/DEAH box helicase [Polyangiaceae bacterium]
MSFQSFPRRKPAHRHDFRQPPASEPRPRATAPVAPIPVTPELAAAIADSPFTALGLVAPIVRAALEEKYTEPSPVQTQVIPPALAGRDVLACAQTGTGKTAAFVLPILQGLSGSESRAVRALILTPTRELAGQIGERITAYGKYLGVRHAVIYGGVNQRGQERALREEPAILVATPGRLLDLLKQRILKLDGVTHFVLDEMDRMLDMGFVRDVSRIIEFIPRVRQTLFFSATIAPAMEKLARAMLKDPARVSISPVVTTAPTVEQSVMFVAHADKRRVLETVLRDETVERAIVFTRTKHGANRLSTALEKSGFGSAAIHGNKTQNARERALDAFRKGTTRVLVATDVAARGIDVQGISLVVNYDLPNVAESYVHRIGRTGRAGATGRAISFCDRDERAYLTDIEKLIRCRLAVVGGQGPAPEPANAGEARRGPANFGQSRSHHDGGGQNRPRAMHGGQSRPHHANGNPERAHAERAVPASGDARPTDAGKPAGHRPASGRQWGNRQPRRYV